MNDKNIFRDVKNRKLMKGFFEKIIKDYFPPGSKLMYLKIKDIGKLKFKKALKYELKIKSPEGKPITKIIRGNIPSKDTKEEIKVADESQRLIYRKGFAFAPFHVPLSLGYYPKLNLVLYEDYPGVPYTKYLKDNHKDLTYLTKQSALWLARFHDLKIKKGRKRPLSLMIKETGYFKENYKNFYPGIYASSATILEKMIPLFKKYIYQDAGIFSLTHGDFNPNNIIVNGNSIGVIDWGRACVYDPINDVANLMAQLNLFLWFKEASPKVISRVKNTFVETYLNARNLKFKDIKTRFLLFELWWIMQIMAYTVSIWPTKKAEVVAQKGLAKAREICDHLGISLKDNLLKRKASLKEIFTDKEVMMKFFNRNLKTFFPKAKHIISLEIDHPEALSKSSFLTKMTLTLAYPGDKKVIKIVRGNVVSLDTYNIMNYINRQDNDLIVPRPLFYFKNIPYLLYDAVSGKRLREIGFKNKNFPIIIKNVAVALARLHQLPVIDINRTRIEETGFFIDIKNKMKMFDPGHLKIFEEYVVKYQTLAKIAFKKSRLVISHNDMQASNIIVMPENKISFIDFSLSSLFYPSFDVANFLTHLEIMLNGVISAAKIKGLQNTFLKTYLRTIGPGLGNQVRKNLGLMRVRAALDIWTITAMLLGPKDKSRKRYISILNHIIKENLDV